MTSPRSMRGVRLVRFGEFELDVRAAELRRSGARVRLQEQPFRILSMLLERPGEVVLREEIQKRLWPNDTVVEVGHGINAAVQRLREALGDSADSPVYVETVARRGYRFRGEAQTVYRSSAPAKTRTEGDSLTGQTVSHYRVCERLGVGGMGVVYRAEDLRLGRAVALKFLPPEMAAEPSAVERFGREARAASALNHPNICTVHAVEEHGGRPVIVMEYLEGETLESALDRGPLDASRTLATAIPIAAALEAAHQKGIVHRDLKPANVFLTKTGVKVLDFGLARMDPALPASSGGHVTRDGSVLGTPQYMSPEQAEGRRAGPASDIYSFGLVVYEMLTGRRSRPALPDASVPDPWAGLLGRCLAQDPADRCSAAELTATLERIHLPRRAPWKLPLRREWLIAAGAIPLAVLVWTVWPAGRKATAAPEQVTRFTVSMPLGINIARVSLAPDGRSVAFVGGGRLCVRAFDELEPRVVNEVEGLGTPFWSPDGRRIALASAGKLRVHNLAGGTPAVLCDVNTNVAGAWGRDSTILIGMVGDGIFRVPETGGALTRVTTVDTARGETRHMLPTFLPGGRRFLYLAGSAKPGGTMLYAASLDSSEHTPIMPLESGATFVPSRDDARRGHLVFARGASVLAQPFDVATLRASGQPQEIAGRVATNQALGASLEIAHFSAAGASLVYLAANAPMQLLPATMSPPRGNFITVVQNWAAGLPR